MISPQLDLGSPAGIWLDMPIKTEKNIAAGQRIKNLIKENAYSQKWVAFKLGYKSASTLSKQCSGENLPRGEELERMAALLHTTVDYILSGKSKDPFSSMPTFVVEKTVKQEEPKREETQNMTNMEKIVEIQQGQIAGLQRQIDSLIKTNELQSNTVANLTASNIKLSEEISSLKEEIKKYQENTTFFTTPLKTVNGGGPGE